MSDQSTPSPASITTPPPPSTLSPPSSQHTTMSQPTLTTSNSNGKRPHTNISNGDDAPPPPRPNADFAVKTHAASGYKWDRIEDEPGYSWKGKKAQDEMARAWEGLVHKDCRVGSKYGDCIEVAEKERAMMEGLK